MSTSSGRPKRECLRDGQYRDSSNLSARIRLHERFSTNTYGWQRWVFDHLRLPEDSRILELGCGAGALWRQNCSRIATGWHIILSDFSQGMVLDARRKLAHLGRPLAYAAADAEAVPFRDRSFDCVIANHMLYHVPAIYKALAEIHRALRPGGRLFAATNGRGHLREIYDLVAEFDANVARRYQLLGHQRFSLENGQAQLAKCFAEVILHRYDDALVIPEAEPLVAYVASALSRPSPLLTSERIAQFEAFIADRLARDGSIRVTKETGMFEARRL